MLGFVGKVFPSPGNRLDSSGNMKGVIGRTENTAQVTQQIKSVRAEPWPVASQRAGFTVRNDNKTKPNCAQLSLCIETHT